MQQRSSPLEHNFRARELWRRARPSEAAPEEAVCKDVHFPEWKMAFLLVQCCHDTQSTRWSVVITSKQHFHNKILKVKIVALASARKEGQFYMVKQLL
jgi:hypothetical protein